LGCAAAVCKVALTMEDVRQYALPPDFTKASDRRARRHIERYGDVAVELDALPVTVLRRRIRHAIEERMDLHALARVRTLEAADRERLLSMVNNLLDTP
jgi:hypothetical protein